MITEEDALVVARVEAKIRKSEAYQAQSKVVLNQQVPDDKLDAETEQNAIIEAGYPGDYQTLIDYRDLVRGMS